MKKTVFLLMVVLSGCSFFDPEAVVDHERLALQYEQELGKLGNSIDAKIIKSVKSHKCEFLEYQEPEFKADAIFKCELVLESSKRKDEDYTDHVILKRYGMEEGKTAILEESAFLRIVADEAFKKEMQTRLGENTP